MAQHTITGSISNEMGERLHGVSVSYGKIGTSLISGFSKADNNGNFSLLINENLDSVMVSFSIINYEKKVIVIKNENKEYHIILKNKTMQLKDVIVTAAPIYKRNDTVNYDVSTFTSKNDLSIGDIIKKLPGVQMDGDKILYQGKPIQKYYVNGLDLLEGRYALANNNLPVGAVQKVQIIENDQPIKILDSLVFSDRASINIKLKKFTTTGFAKVGVGLYPFIRDVSVSPMTFNKNFQTINTFQSNNIGDNVANQLVDLGVDNMLEQINSSKKSYLSNPSLLTIQSVQTPPLEEKRWLNNDINMLSSNILQKLKNGVELKSNVSYVNNKSSISGDRNTVIFTPQQQLNINEQTENGYGTDDLNAKFVLLKNEKKVYLKNSLILSKKWLRNTGQLVRDSSSNIDQLNRTESASLVNNFSAVLFIGKQLVNLNSYVGYLESPQRFSVTPGQFQESLNNNVAYQKTTQNLKYSTFNTNNFMGLVKSAGKFSFLPKLGFAVQKQELNSDIELKENGQEAKLGNDFINNLSLIRTEVYLENQVQFKAENWKIDVGLPVSLKNYDIGSKVAYHNNDASFFVFEPSLLAIHNWSNLLKSSVLSGYRQDFGEIGTLYDGFILNSYSNLQKFNTNLTRSYNWKTSVAMNYENTSSAVFFNISVDFDDIQRNYIYQNSIDDKGYNTIKILFKNNKVNRNVINADVSKYALPLKTLLKLSSQIGSSKSEYLFEETYSEIRQRYYNLGFSLNNTSSKYVSVDYNTKIGLMHNKIADGPKTSKLFFAQQHLLLNIFPFKNHIITFGSDYYSSNQQSIPNQLFFDMKYRFNLTKHKIFFEIAAINLSNRKSYLSIYNSDFSIIRDSFGLRPRQLLASVRFNF